MPYAFIPMLIKILNPWVNFYPRIKFEKIKKDPLKIESGSMVYGYGIWTRR
jgi:hypothetical protein